MVTSNTDKFLLLTWKNWKLQSKSIRITILEIVIPILFSSLLIAIRYVVDIEHINKPTEYPQLNIDLDVLKDHMLPNTASPVGKWELAYSPKNDIIDKIVKEASLTLGVTTYGLENGAELEKYMQQPNQSLVGILFRDTLAKITELPKDISYSLRFPSELRSFDVEYAHTWETRSLYPLFDFGGPRFPENELGGDPSYFIEGFIAVQNEISLNIIKELSKENSLPNENIPEIETQRMPYPPYTKDSFLNAIEAFVPLIMLLSYIHLASETIKYIAIEKEKQLKEVMKIMGLSNWLHWLAWFFKTFILMSISITVIVILFEYKWIGDSDVAVFTYTDWSCLLVFLYIYAISSITYFFMITTFFNSAKTASAVNGLIWFMFYIPYALTTSNYKNMNIMEKLVLCLLHNTALGYGFKLILLFEGIGVGLQWNNLFRPVNIDDNLSVGLIWIMMLISSVIYMLIALYVEQIFPGEYGVPQKWYFIFTKEFWFTKKYKNSDDSSIDSSFDSSVDSVVNNKPIIEENTDKNKKIGVSIKKLNKKFKTKQAVTNLSMNLYENEITVLLGHNGAGKTTTISMLTGMIPPTSGTAIINGSDIRTNINGVRSSLGLCPQHNILFDELTVKEHIVFYSRVKGLNSTNIDQEVNKYVKILHLERKLNTQSKSLSGGMKRKLSVICALCGNTKVVFLDEPSTGMDPAARRTLWDILYLEKNNRTILLSTHYMDEADAVGDRIAIMSASELKCYGTSFFLKKKYGTGYHLICVKKNDCDPQKITNLLKTYIPDIEIDKNIGTELSYQLPDAYSKKFEEMLSKLEANSNDLKLEGYGVSITSLEEVFMRVGSEKHNTDITENNINTGVTTNICESVGIADMGGNQIKRSRTAMIISQFKAMLLKKILYSRRNIIIFLLQNIIVLSLVILSILVEQTHKTSRELSPLSITLNSYEHTVNILQTDNNLDPFQLKIAEEYKNYVNMHGNSHKVIEIHSDLSEYILKQDIVEVNSKYLTAATISNNKIIAWFNNQLLHTHPLSMNIIHNAILRAVKPGYSIYVTNYPLPKALKTIQIAVSSGDGFGFQLALNCCIALSFACSFFVLFIIKERSSRAKLLQFVSGVRGLIFWLSHLLFDYFIFIIIAILTLSVIALFEQPGYTTFPQMGRIFLVMLCFGLAMLPFIYLMSMLFTEPVTGFSYISLFNIICVALFIIIFVMRFLNKVAIADTLNYVFLMFPIYSLSTALTNLNIISSMEEACIKQCKYHAVSSTQCSIELMCKLVDKCCLPEYFAYKYPGVGWNVIYMMITFVICLFCLLIGSQRFVKETCHKIKIKILPPPMNPTTIHSNLDDDVLEENERIDHMSTDEIESNNLVLKQASKYYGKFLAVNNVSFAINEYECFGLLGINGAGKTTLFKMMTGDEIITYGDALVKGKNLRNEMNEIYRDIGYCPQFDALLEDLTGREILRIFCLLRGIPENKINYISNKMAILFGYTKHIDKPCKTYSGGNKRKLSTSIAILGCPSVVYLDEPTGGMDPGSRRQLWNAVNQVRSSGKSIILTSHSMEECEALCTRLAIMVNGQFKCIGSTQHLKNKFARGLILKIKVKRDDKNLDRRFAENTENVDRIKVFVDRTFSQAILQEEYQEMLTFHIPIGSMKWSQIFGIIEKNKEALQIEDYAISQTTLEQIFLSFAEQQEPEKRKSIP